MLSVALKNDRKPNTPQTGGKWSDPDRPGDSDWIPDPEATFSYKGEEIPYGDLMKAYSFDHITYRNQLPDFSGFADPVLGMPKIETMPDERTGRGGSYRQAAEWVVNRANGFSSVEEVKQYMEAHGLVWHEIDLHHVIAIPGKINAAFPHMGGIGLGNSIERIGESILGKTGGRWITVEER